MDGSAPGDLDPEGATLVPAAEDASADEPIGISGDEATIADASPPGPSGPQGRLRRGQAVGRFIVVDPLGAGAMGEVVAAYDPDLHRRVAIKVLRVQSGGSSGGAGATERMLREARAMAQLAHPNVITVFEVDELEHGELFIAMEFVDGGTLRSWGRQTEEPRPWREVLEVYAQAARGLAGAHVVGLIHRDFKPDNVLIGSDGRVRVTDFGLVGVDPRLDSGDATTDSATGLSLEAISGSGSSAALEALVDVTLTRTGTVMGTPAYMAPEQERGQADARSDQFSFCVALYEALYGERPFAGDTLALLRANVAGGRFRAEPKNSGVPSWLRVVVLRGLSPDPQERWDSMEDLVRQLQRDPSVRRRQVALGAAGVLVFGGLLAWSAIGREPTADPCEGSGDKVSTVWNNARSDSLRDAFEGVDTDRGAKAHGALARALDSFANDWAAARRGACEATLVRGEQSDLLFDRRMRCLDRRLQRADALVTAFESPTADSLAKAEAGVAAVPSLDRCADAEALEAEIPPPEEPRVREDWERLHRELDRADALGVAGNEIASLALYEAVAPDVAKIEHPPLTARLQLNYGNALVRQERWTEAIKVLDPGPATAAASGDAVVEAKMWLLLAKATGFGLNDSKTGAAMARAAAVAAVRAGDDPDLRIGIQYTSSLLCDADGDFEGAVEYAQRAVELALAAHGKEHRTTSTLYGQLGAALDHAGRYDEAMRAHRTSMDIDTAMHGPEHPDVAHSLVNIGLLLQNEGKYAESDEHFANALSIYEKTVGRKSGAYSTALLNQAQTSFYKLEFEEARDRFLSLLELYQQTRPAMHADIAIAHQNLGSVYTHLEQLDEAENHYRHAYRIRRHVYGEEHPKVMHSINAMAQVLARKGRLEEAESELWRAVEIGEKSLPTDHPDLAYPLQNLANVIAEQERYEEAIPLLERTVELRADINPNLLGRSEAALARVLYFTDRPRSMKMFDEAASKMDELGRAEIQQFIDMVK